MTGKHQQPPAPGARMCALLALTPKCEVAADVGCDHAYLAVYWLARGLCARAVAADVSDHAVARARANLARCGYADRADCVAGDGLAALTAVERVDVVALAGLGADTIRAILEDGDAYLAEQKPVLLLAPNRDPDLLRTWASRHRYAIDKERLAREGRRFYVVMRLVPGDMRPDDATPARLYTGGGFDGAADADTAAYWAWRIGVLRRERGDPDTARRLGWIEGHLRDRS